MQPVFLISFLRFHPHPFIVRTAQYHLQTLRLLRIHLDLSPIDLLNRLKCGLTTIQLSSRLGAPALELLGDSDRLVSAESLAHVDHPASGKIKCQRWDGTNA